MDQMKLVPVVALVATVVASCHSATIHVVRRSSGAVFGDLEFLPVRGTDLHYISFSLSPFANCVDALQALSKDNHGRLTRNACDSRTSYQDFLGYGFSEPLAVDDSGSSCQRGSPADGGCSPQRSKRARVSWVGEGPPSPQFLTSQHDAAARILALVDEGEESGVIEPKAITSFIHMSDVQIREHEATLGSKGLSTRLDSLIQSFQRDADQEIYSSLMYAAVVDTINAELHVQDPQRPSPLFMIHTGDAVDAGLQSEFEQFRALSDRLKIPWYQVIGNHDVLAFGNMRMIADPSREPQLGCDGKLWKGIDCTCTRVADLVRELVIGDAAPDNRGNPVEIRRMPSLVPVLLKRICIVHKVEGDRFVMNPEHYRDTVRSFVAAHCREPGPGRTECLPPSDGIAMQYADASGIDDDAPCAVQPKLNATHSVMNGFDLRLPASSKHDAAADRRRLAELVLAIRHGEGDAVSRELAVKALAKLEPGYYCFELPRVEDAGPRIWGVVLNTSTPNGAYAEVSGTQLSWLKQVLESRQILKTDLVLVFAHHPVYDMFDLASRDRLIELLTSHDNVIAYFAGHTHAPGLRLIHPPADGQVERTNHHVWEVVAPALISYPQQGRQVTVKTMGGVGYLEILTFAPNGDGAISANLGLARQGALRDKCHEAPENCENGRPSLPKQQLMFSRLFFKLPKR